MHIKYRKQKIVVPFCENCNEKLRGDNSYANPYTCSCGIWKSDWMNPSEYEIVKATRQRGLQKEKEKIDYLREVLSQEEDD